LQSRRRAVADQLDDLAGRESNVWRRGITAGVGGMPADDDHPPPGAGEAGAEISCKSELRGQSNDQAPAAVEWQWRGAAPQLQFELSVPQTDVERGNAVAP